MKTDLVVERGTASGIYFLLAVAVSILMFSCEPEEDKLGVDLFPPSDTITIYTDTLNNIGTMLVRSQPVITSIEFGNSSSTRNYLLGSKVDTMTGMSRAEIITEFGISSYGDFGEDPYVDSLSLHLYFADVVGDTSQDMHITVYEFLDSLAMDSAYYSDYDVSGKYDPVPMVDEIIAPHPGELYQFPIENAALLQRIKDATNPADSVFIQNAKLQRAFHGLYITTETVSSGGAIAKVQLGSLLSGLKFKYYHDSVTTEAMDTVALSTYNIGFSNYIAQKVNIFSHDYSGTAVEALLDNPEAKPEIGYVQGMAGINVKLSLPDIVAQLGFKEDEKIAINAANILFYVVPEEISGINEEDYPDKLTMNTISKEGKAVELYDELINTNDFYFGKLTRSNEQSAFYEPLYYYNFHIGRHLQSLIIDGDLDNTDLYVYPENPEITTKIIKFWSNYSGQEGGLRLELIYTKF